ncbi:MAG TPA: ShlB/FhaC/HecB family hemolysin secretion/activation protein [Methylocella sp.]|nr:ShlB/FhaC/HecB family hemolysin secretion/activation protein [Methylocella sp.]
MYPFRGAHILSGQFAWQRKAPNRRPAQFSIISFIFFSSLAAAPSTQAAIDQVEGAAPSGGQASDGPRAKTANDPSLRKAKPPASSQRFDIDEYRVIGADTLQQIDVEEAVYPFLGPKRTAEDVEKARAALEKSYHDKGYQTVNVSIPPQNPQNGIVVLKVTENRVGRLRVKGSRYFDFDPIKKRATSLAEGTVPNFNAVTKDIVTLNQWPDRRVTPALSAGATPDTVDVDLNVEDKLPLHGSVEFNNRQAPDTEPLRISTNIHYDDLWQLGHSISFSYQVAPQNPADVEVYSGSYLLRLPDNDFVSLLAYGVDSMSNVSTVGNTDVIGPGQIIGSRVVVTLPPLTNLYHSVSFGADYKHFAQQVENGTAIAFSSPVTYAPIVASYNANWQAEGSLLVLGASVTSGLRGIGSNPAAFEARRDGAQDNFVHFNADLSYTQELPLGLQLFARTQAQFASLPLVSSEQFCVGGLDTVRGYLECEVLGDTGVAGTLEFRTPNIGPTLQSLQQDEKAKETKSTYFNDVRFFAFFDGASAMILQPLPEQRSSFDLYSFGVGARLKLANHLNGMVVLSVPMITQSFTKARERRVNFRLWGEF